MRIRTPPGASSILYGWEARQCRFRGLATNLLASSRAWLVRTLTGVVWFLGQERDGLAVGAGRAVPQPRSSGSRPETRAGPRR